MSRSKLTTSTVLRCLGAICFFAAILILSLSAPAQSALGALLQANAPPGNSSKAATDSLGRQTPYGTIFGFLENAQAGRYGIADEYLQMTPARRQHEGEVLAEKLKTVMDSTFAGSLKHVSTQPEGTPEEGIPNDRQKLGTMSSGDVEVDLELVRVSDPSAGRIWLISSDTLATVPELYDQVEARQVETKLPRWLVKYQFAGMPLWQWLALILLIPVAAAAAWLLLAVLQIPLRWWGQTHGQHEMLRWRSVSGPAWLLAATLIHRILAGYLGMPLLQRHYYFEATALAVIVGTSWIFWRVMRWFLRRVRTQALARGHAGTGSLLLLVERLVKAVVVIMAGFSILGILGVNLTTALAGVGIGTLAIGFGAQQTIANLFGGVSVMWDEVIHVGDVCKFGDRTGTVEDIGLRSTRVRTEERTLLAIPNGTVATINVENLSRREKILFKTVLGFHLDTSADQLRAALAEIRRVLSSHQRVEPVRVRLIELGSAAINVELTSYILTTNFDEYAAIREELLLQIMKFVEDTGASLAKPSLYLSSKDNTIKDKIEAAAGKGSTGDGKQ